MAGKRLRVKMAGKRVSDECERARHTMSCCHVLPVGASTCNSHGTAVSNSNSKLQPKHQTLQQQQSTIPIYPNLESRYHHHDVRKNATYPTIAMATLVMPTAHGHRRQWGSSSHVFIFIIIIIHPSFATPAKSMAARPRPQFHVNVTEPAHPDIVIIFVEGDCQLSRTRG